MANEVPYILWLASWYPNKIEPFAGDFVQRHARAASLFFPVTVFYISQSGIDVEIDSSLYLEKKENNLTEVTIFFKFKKTGFTFFDKVVYNLHYRQTYKKYIRKYFKDKGLPSLIHVHIPVKAGLIALWIKKKWGVPYFVTEHSTHYNNGTSHDFVNRNKFYRNAVSRIFRNSDKNINVSYAMGRRMENMFNLSLVSVIHNTVDSNLFYCTGANADPFRFIHVSTLNEEQKNIQGIIRSVAMLAEKRKDFHFVIVGPVTETLWNNIESSGLKKIISFTGEISYENVAEEMRQSSALVLFSWYENSPCVVGEALCCGLPVISSDVGGVNELVNDENGILIQPGNEKQLVESMERMMDGYIYFDREKIAAEATSQYSYEAIGAAFFSLYSKMLKQTKRP